MTPNSNYENEKAKNISNAQVVFSETLKFRKFDFSGVNSLIREMASPHSGYLFVRREMTSLQIGYLCAVTRWRLYRPGICVFSRQMARSCLSATPTGAICDNFTEPYVAGDSFNILTRD